MVVIDNSNQLVVNKEIAMPQQEQTEVRRQVDVEATPEEVFEALITPEGRDRWLDEPEREIHIESAEHPSRVVWWWSTDEEPATRVDFRIVALPHATRVVVIESAPNFPLARMAAGLELVLA